MTITIIIIITGGASVVSEGGGRGKPCVEQLGARACQPSLQYDKKKINNNGTYVIKLHRLPTLRWQLRTKVYNTRPKCVP